MYSSLLGCASALALLSVAVADTASSYPANTNTNCGTSSDVDYQKTYYYDPNDTQDWGFYVQSTGTCDSGSYARVHVKDPQGNDNDCGYFPLTGALTLISCANWPRGYLQEGAYTLYLETVPGANQYSWNQFTVTHAQGTVTAATPTSTITTTPLTVMTSTVISTLTDTKYIDQSTVTVPSATMTNFINVTPAPTTITTTSTSYFTIPVKKYALTTILAVTTAPCYRASITKDMVGSRKSKQTTFKWWKPRSEAAEIVKVIHQIRHLRIRDDVPNTVGVVGLPATTTITPSPVISTVTAATSTSIVTSTSYAPGVTVTSVNPTPTLTVYSGNAVITATTTLPQVTKSIVKNKLALTMVTTTVTLTYTQKSVTTPVCAPTP